MYTMATFRECVRSRPTYGRTYVPRPARRQSAVPLTFAMHERIASIARDRRCTFGSVLDPAINAALDACSP